MREMMCVSGYISGCIRGVSHLPDHHRWLGVLTYTYRVPYHVQEVQLYKQQWVLMG